MCFDRRNERLLCAMNLFFAFRLHQQCQQRLADTMQRFQSWQMPARWQHPDDLHITLAYLGAWDEDRVAQLRHDVDLLLSGVVYPQLAIHGVAGFAGKQWPRVVYAAIADDEAVCADLHRDLLDLCSVQSRQSYVPHVTLCRPEAAGRDHSWTACLEAMRDLFWDGPVVRDIALMTSQAAASGPRYRSLATWPCIGAAV